MPCHVTPCPTQVHKGRKSFLVGAVVHSVSDRPASAIHCGFFLTVMNGGGGQAVGARGVPGLPPSTPAFSAALQLPIMAAKVTGAGVRIPHSLPSIAVCPPRPWPSVQTCPGWLLRAQVRVMAPTTEAGESPLAEPGGAGGLGLGSRPPWLLLIHRLWLWAQSWGWGLQAFSFLEPKGCPGRLAWEGGSMPAWSLLGSLMCLLTWVGGVILLWGAAFPSWEDASRGIVSVSGRPRSLVPGVSAASELPAPLRSTPQQGVHRDQPPEEAAQP